MGFTKLDSGIIDSSLWDEPANVLKVFIAFWTKSDSEGVVNATFNAMVRTANLCDENKAPLPVSEFEKALNLLMSPDESSRTKDKDGRRIIRVSESQWIITTYKKHREFSYSNNPEAVKKRKQRHLGTFGDMSQVSKCVPGHSASASASESASVSELGLGDTGEGGSLQPEAKHHWLIEYWQKADGTTHHRTITDKMTEAAKRVSSVYPTQDLLACVDNYAEIMRSPDDYFGKYAHGFEEFFRRGTQKPPPFEKFLPERSPLKTLIKNRAGKNGRVNDGSGNIAKPGEFPEHLTFGRNLLDPVTP